MEEKNQLKEKRRLPRSYSEELKRKVCQEVAAGLLTKMEAIKKYDIRHRSGVITWLREYGMVEPTEIRRRNRPSKKSFTMPNLSKVPDDALIIIKQLKKALDEAEFRAEAFCKMIDIAENEFNIRIRKKSYTKPSKS